MRVLYVNMGGRLVAGSERSMLDLIAAAGGQIEAHVLCNSQPLADAVERLGARATVADLVEFSPYAAAPCSIRRFWGGVRAVAACIDRFRPDLVHANNVWPTQLAVTAAAMRHMPVVAHVRATTYRSGQNLSLLRLADHIVAVSEAAARPFRAMRLRRGPVTVVYNPVAVAARPDAAGRESHRADLRSDGASCVRLAVAGRLSQEKAIHRAIELLAWLRVQGLQAELTIFGDGPQRSDLESCVARNRLDGFVAFAGYCDDLPARLARADAVLLSSLREGLPRVIVEAGMVGVPTIACRVGGIAEVIDSGQSGLLVEDFESPASRQAIRRVLGDRRRLRDMGRRAQELCRRRFTPARAFEATLAVYRQVRRRRCGRQTMSTHRQ